MNAFLITFGLIFFLGLVVWRREWGIYLIILLLPTYQIRFQVFGIPMTFLEGMILILTAVTGIEVIYKKFIVAETFRFPLYGSLKTSVTLLIIVFLLAAAISIFVSPVTLKAAGIFKAYFFEAVLFYFLVLLIIDTPQKLQGIFRSLALLALYLSAFGIYQFFTLSNLPFSWWAVDVASRRITSLLNHPNALALLLGPILALLIFRPQKSKLDFAAIAFGIIALYLSFSRAAWLGLIMTIAIFTLLSWRERAPSPSSPGEGRRSAVGGQERSKLLLLVIVISSLFLTIPFSRQKILDLAQGQDLASQNRLVLWSAAADMLKKSPIFGVGLMGFREAYKNYPLGPDRVVQNYPHNFFLNFWVEVGLLGLISIIGLLVIFFIKIYLVLKSPSPYPSPQGRGTKINSSPLRGEDKGGGEKSLALAAAAAGMTMVLLHGLVDVSYFKNDLSVLFWLIYALPFLTLLPRRGGQ